MSQRDVERALGRMLTDPAFRQGFVEDPGRACLQLGLQLAPPEMEALLRLPRAALVDLADRLDDRICRFHALRPDPSPHNGR
ncbi:MAG TPA: Os1348 family NHLP clan protein [Candidatus Baltobacteraceae bacterium]|nr:Os1348 family NHLP clan protein [Candidatus Baltobacteraceae bacterium]